MRADVKLGVVCSAVIVLVAGGYYTWRSPASEPIALDPSAKPESAVKAGASDSARSPGTVQRPGTGNAGSATNPATTGRPQPTSNRQPTTRTRPSADSQDSANRATDPTQRITRQPRNTSPTSDPTRPTGTPRRDPRTAVVPPTSETSPAETSPRRADRPEAASETSIGQGQDDRTATAGDTSSTTSSDAAPITRHPSDEAGGVGPASRPSQSASNQDRPTAATGFDPGAGRTTDAAADRRPVPRGELSARTQPRDTTRTLSRDAALNPAAVATETHIVQPGDSFSSIARKYYGSERHTSFLIQSNPQIANPNLLSIGNQILIPPKPPEDQAAVAASTPASREGTSAVSGAASGQRTYRVREGDSFYGIARDVLGNAMRWNEIFELNRQAVDGDPTRLRAGQTIILPKQ